MNNLFSYNKIYPRLVTKNIEIDGYFTLYEKKIIMEAICDWNEISQGLVTFRITNFDTRKIATNKTKDNVVIIKSFASDEAIQLIEKQHGSKIVGFANTVSTPNIIFIVADKLADKKMYKNVVIHELGHIAYLPHSKHKNSVMYYMINTNGLKNQDIMDLIYVHMIALNSHQ